MPEQFILKRTITEEYEYDDAQLRTKFQDQFEAWKVDWTNRHYPPLDNEQLRWEWFVIELFEQHEGSAYGDELFGQINVDAGIELQTREEE